MGKQGGNIVGVLELQLLGVAPNNAKLYVFHSYLVLHYLLKGLQHKVLALRKTHLGLVLFLQSGHGRIAAAADGPGLPLVVGAGGVGLEELGTVFVDASNEKSNSERSGHGLALATLVTLTKVHSKIANRLGDEVHREWLDVVELVVLGLNAGVVNEYPSVAYDATHGAGAVFIDFNKFFGLDRLLQLGHELFLHAQYHTFAGLHAN